MFLPLLKAKNWWERQKCIDSTKHEKISYDAILGGKDVIGDDYDIDSSSDFVKALLSDFMEKTDKDAKDCVEEDVVEVVIIPLHSQVEGLRIPLIDSFYNLAILDNFQKLDTLVSHVLNSM